GADLAVGPDGQHGRETLVLPHVDLEHVAGTDDVVRGQLGDRALLGRQRVAAAGAARESARHRQPPEPVSPVSQHVHLAFGYGGTRVDLHGSIRRAEAAATLARHGLAGALPVHRFRTRKTDAQRNPTLAELRSAATASIRSAVPVWHGLCI